MNQTRVIVSRETASCDGALSVPNWLTLYEIQFASQLELRIRFVLAVSEDNLN